MEISRETLKELREWAERKGIDKRKLRNVIRLFAKYGVPLDVEDIKSLDWSLSYEELRKELEPRLRLLSGKLPYEEQKAKYPLTETIEEYLSRIHEDIREGFETMTKTLSEILSDVRYLRLAVPKLPEQYIAPPPEFEPCRDLLKRYGKEIVDVEFEGISAFRGTTPHYVIYYSDIPEPIVVKDFEFYAMCGRLAKKYDPGLYRRLVEKGWIIPG